MGDKLSAEVAVGYSKAASARSCSSAYRQREGGARSKKGLEFSTGCTQVQGSPAIRLIIRTPKLRWAGRATSPDDLAAISSCPPTTPPSLPPATPKKAAPNSDPFFPPENRSPIHFGNCFRTGFWPQKVAAAWGSPSQNFKPSALSCPVGRLLLMAPPLACPFLW